MHSLPTGARRFLQGSIDNAGNPPWSGCDTRDWIRWWFTRIAQFEYAASVTSSGVLALLRHIPLREFFPRFAANYFKVVCAWYGGLRAGASGGEVYAAAERARDPALYDFAVNPGHYLHLDESVLLLSNIAGWLPPYSLDLSKALVTCNDLAPCALEDSPMDGTEQDQ